MLIDKNLEARSSDPAGGPHHGRGNRGGRGDNRGHRDNRGNRDGGDKRDRKMQPTNELIDALFWERVELARRMPPVQKMLPGLELFDLTTKIMADGIRDQFPDTNEERVKEILHERLVVCPSRLYHWVPLLACPAVPETRLDKPTVAPVNSTWTDH